METPATIDMISKPVSRKTVRVAAVAWLLTAVYYFYQYALRSAPAVMMPQLSEAFGLSALGVASIIGLFYYGYSPFSLVAGAAMDRMGPRRLLPVAAVVVAHGSYYLASRAKLVFPHRGNYVGRGFRLFSSQCRPPSRSTFSFLPSQFVFPPSRVALRRDLAGGLP